MRIVILGAGTVGSWIADLLCRNRHSVTVVDINPENTSRVNEEYDVMAITGSASQSSVLFQAGVIGADVCLAVTGDDEVNIVAASMAKAMGARRAVARVYAPVFRDLSTFDYQRHFQIDRMLSLEHLSASELARNIRNPGSVVLENFARGELEVQEVIVSEPSVNGVAVKDLGLPPNVRIGSIYRDGKMWTARADDNILSDDRIVLIGKRSDVDAIKDSFQKEVGPKLGVVIAGGGETGYHLARALENERFSVLLMDESAERCEFLANHLKRTTVVQADATRKVILEEERVGSADVFVACIGGDENNIMAGVEAREIGAKKVMAVVGRPDYAHIVNKLGIDVAVSERDVMARQVLGFLNTGHVISRTALPGGRISVFEIEVVEGALATEHVLANLPLPQSCLIAAVMREEFVRVPGADDRLQPGDTVVALLDEAEVDDVLEQFSPDGR
ncbi:MAG: Trk system potassium transporter TrkA [Pirellulaceae bacterium]|jgi:trk system potassium uptake protein TrkA|nr:Trk system potassium transporter TrkA [Pirellulaceae bacterium]MDP7019218.1 Trk system potassium transporter TrkA [Pirellulaceae bacterium]